MNAAQLMHAIDSINWYRLAAFGLGLAATLVLAAWLTPRAWWRRPNLRALLVVAGGTWGLGSLAALMLPAQAATTTVTAVAAVVPLAPVAPLASFAPPLVVTQAPAQTYRAHRDINLRSSPGTGSRRIAIIAAGTSVEASGWRDGDWWQLTATLDGKRQSGWASSLWLRRIDEAVYKNR